MAAARQAEDTTAGARALPRGFRAGQQGDRLVPSTTAPDPTNYVTGQSDQPPYETGLDALRDGWRLFQAAQLIPPQSGHEWDTSFLKHEFYFERLEEISS